MWNFPVDCEGKSTLFKIEGLLSDIIFCKSSIVFNACLLKMERLSFKMKWRHIFAPSMEKKFYVIISVGNLIALSMWIWYFVIMRTVIKKRFLSHLSRIPFLNRILYYGNGTPIPFSEDQESGQEYILVGYQ